MKRKTEELIEEISDFLIVYLKSGRVSLNSFVKDVHLNIRNLDELLQIHFLLKDEVKQFVRELPRLIRRFKTSTKSDTEIFQGEIRGQINWPQTMNERLKRNYSDRTIFSCNERNRNYNIKENLVLKEFIRTLYRILFQTSLNYEKYEWFADWKELKGIVEHLFTKNIYLLRVSLDHVNITNRMLIETSGHRNPLYRQSANLLILYRNLLSRNLNVKEIKQLLKETFVLPDREEVLFELYWVIQIIKQNNENAMLELIDGKQNLVASWSKNGLIYKIYHDSKGSSQLHFQVSTDEVRGSKLPYLNKRLESMDLAFAISQEAFGQSFASKNFWNGRPDIIVEIYDQETSDLVKVIIGEVKHTLHVDYAIKGLRELIDYMKLMKDKQDIYFSDQDLPIKGILCVDNVLLKQSEFQNVRIINHENKHLLEFYSHLD